MMTSDDFNKQIENIYEEAGKDMSPLFKEYNDNRTEYLERMTANIEDPEKKVLAEKVLDAISDAYNLTRIKNSPSKIKIKSYQMEEPEKVYKSCIEFKYKESNNNSHSMPDKETLILLIIIIGFIIVVICIVGIIIYLKLKKKNLDLKEQIMAISFTNQKEEKEEKTVSPINELRETTNSEDYETNFI